MVLNPGFIQIHTPPLDFDGAGKATFMSNLPPHLETWDPWMTVTDEIEPLMREIQGSSFLWESEILNYIQPLWEAREAFAAFLSFCPFVSYHWQKQLTRCCNLQLQITTSQISVIRPVSVNMLTTIQRAIYGNANFSAVDMQVWYRKKATNCILLAMESGKNF